MAEAQPGGVDSGVFVIVDYSKGNLRSVQKSLELAGASTCISANAADIRAARAIVLPGVGAFADASRTMLASGQMQAIRDAVQAGVPFLGICLGMQLLFERGDEGMPEGSWAEGLGLLKGSCTRVAATDDEGRSYKVPHVGWNQVQATATGQASSVAMALFAGVEDGSNFYFTHSYECVPADEQEVLATTRHAQFLPSVAGKENICGVQFHPEKSSHKGLLFMSNFVRWVRERATTTVTG